jgi:hypothetical protein
MAFVDHDGFVEVKVFAVFGNVLSAHTGMARQAGCEGLREAHARNHAS